MISFLRSHFLPVGVLWSRPFSWFNPCCSSLCYNFQYENFINKLATLPRITAVLRIFSPYNWPILPFTLPTSLPLPFSPLSHFSNSFVDYSKFSFPRPKSGLLLLRKGLSRIREIRFGFCWGKTRERKIIESRIFKSGERKGVGGSGRG